MEAQHIQDSSLKANGRFGRLSYAAWSFLITIIWYITLITVFLIAGAMGGTQTVFSQLGIISGIITLVIYILFIYFVFVVSIRRLHDLNQTGWLSILFILPLINLFFWVYLLVAPGTDGANKFGAKRETKAWEKVIGWIYVIMIPVTLLLGIFVAVPAYESYVERAKHAQIQMEQQSSQTDYNTRY